MINIFWIFTELAANAVNSFLCINFIVNSFNKECKKTNLKNTYIIGVSVVAAVTAFLNSVTLFEGLSAIIYPVLCFVFSLIFMHGAFWKKFLLSVLMIICLMSTSAISGNVIGAFVKNDPAQIYTKLNTERFIIIVIELLLRAYVFSLMLHFTRSKEYFLKAKEWTLIISVLGISFFMLAVLQITVLDNNGADPVFLMIIELGIIVINALCLYITANLSETHKRVEELLIEKNRSEYNQEYTRNVTEQYEQTRRLRHDIKQFAATLLRLIQEGKIDTAEQLAKNQTLDISQNETVIRVDNEIVNAILNTKLSYAKFQGIEVFCSVENGISGIEDTDLCNLLGNLLDNAITASKRCKEGLRLIEVSMAASEKRLTITVKNSIPDSVLKVNPELESTEPKSKEHGFGIKSIKYIAEKYNGSTDFYEEEHTFISRVILKRKTE